MNKILLAVPAALALFASAPAQADVATVVLTPVGANGSMTGTFDHINIGAGDFLDDLEIVLSVAGFLSATISSSFSVPTTGDIDFTLVDLAGVDFRIDKTGQAEGRSLEPVFLDAGTYRLRVRGTSNGEATYSGNLTFATAQAVPEPATWALMILGFGGMGATLRRKRSTPALA